MNHAARQDPTGRIASQRRPRTHRLWLLGATATILGGLAGDREPTEPRMYALPTSTAVIYEPGGMEP